MSPNNCAQSTYHDVPLHPMSPDVVGPSAVTPPRSRLAYASLDELWSSCRLDRPEPVSWPSSRVCTSAMACFLSACSDSAISLSNMRWYTAAASFGVLARRYLGTSTGLRPAEWRSGAVWRGVVVWRCGGVVWRCGGRHRHSEGVEAVSVSEATPGAATFHGHRSSYQVAIMELNFSCIRRSGGELAS